MKTIVAALLLALCACGGVTPGKDGADGAPGAPGAPGSPGAPGKDAPSTFISSSTGFWTYTRTDASGGEWYGWLLMFPDTYTIDGNHVLYGDSMDTGTNGSRIFANYVVQFWQPVAGGQIKLKPLQCFHSGVEIQCDGSTWTCTETTGVTGAAYKFQCNGGTYKDLNWFFYR